MLLGADAVPAAVEAVPCNYSRKQILSKFFENIHKNIGVLFVKVAGLEI